jgi:integrase/recombinase XerD
MLDKVSVSTINGRIIVYRILFSYLIKEKLITENPMDGIQKLKEPKPIRNVLTLQDVERLLGTIQRNTFYGSRDTCIILLCYDAMLRIGEVCNLKIKDVDLQRNCVKVVSGKGKKDRYAGFSTTTAFVLHKYITRHRTGVSGDLLVSTKDGHRIGYRQALRLMMKPAKRVGMKVNPHLLRHSGASAWVRNNGSIAVLQRNLGHASLATTQKYLHLNETDLLNAYKEHSPATGIRI